MSVFLFFYIFLVIFSIWDDAVSKRLTDERLALQKVEEKGKTVPYEGGKGCQFLGN